ncbi:MAG: hypothetical protein LBM62_04100 [Mediterranea sp.]|nr:hypothetical protein [Mediterranea sp.]
MNIPSNIKKRDSYIKRIAPFMRKSLIKVLTGQRRVGKSYMGIKHVYIADFLKEG